MIKVLVVDDDKLVRKGLISAMPWREFGMEVIGEANHGEKALEFLEAHEVDLLLTDLAMPVMSGIELMRIVRKRYPHISIVVLTLHQDFEYVQEALRLGAIDYIAKVQLEKERFEEVLGRILDRIRQERHPFGADGGAASEQEDYATDSGTAFLSLEDPQDTRWLDTWSDEGGNPAAEIDSRLWLWVPTGNVDSAENRLAPELAAAGKHRLPPGWVLLQLQGLSGKRQKDVHRSLREFRDKELFYRYHPKETSFTLDLNQPCDLRSAPSEETMSSLKAQWLSHEWFHQETLFRKLLAELKELRLPQPKLIGLLYSLFDEWNRVFYPVTLMKLSLRESYDYWYQVEEWLHTIRGLIRQAVGKPAYSQEVTDCVMKALTIMREELARPVTAAEIAKRVSMSRSYFSQCFKGIAGKTFNDYLRQLRVDKAKEYLLYTNKTILWIAENTGYSDEKYFSRTFRDLTGMLPSEYRQVSREGREMSGK